MGAGYYSKWAIFVLRRSLCLTATAAVGPRLPCFSRRHRRGRRRGLSPSAWGLRSWVFVGLSR
ncbi:unnamed protein product, partial [Amoebophrya sp. A25]|eukprot:GSA25T00028005001.1